MTLYITIYSDYDHGQWRSVIGGFISYFDDYYTLINNTPSSLLIVYSVTSTSPLPSQLHYNRKHTSHPLMKDLMRTWSASICQIKRRQVVWLFNIITLFFNT